ncbi:hypothetical protein ACH41H_45575 [Streptomyces sp. NPDC020800]|uniref:hypothetical protein n=1 Tax=Streptomyces sp. NPDC020800 TaxID=3365092 RepID=UPI00379F6CC1
MGPVVDLFRRWQRNGTWQRVFTQLQARADTKDLITWDLNVDSTLCRADQHAAGARKRGNCRRSLPAEWALDSLAAAARELGIRVGRSRVCRFLLAEGVRWCTRGPGPARRSLVAMYVSCDVVST